MFQFPSLAPFGHPVLPGWGFPIRKSRGQTLVCQLTRAYRRLLRPSSPPNAKAFTVCPSIIHTKTISLKSTDTNISYQKTLRLPPFIYAKVKERSRSRGLRETSTNRSLKNRQQRPLFTILVPSSEDARSRTP